MNIDNFISSIDAENKVSAKTGKPFKIWTAALDDGTVIKFGFNKPPYAVGQRIVGKATANRFGDLEFHGAGSVTPETKPVAGRSPAAPGVRTFPVGTTSPEMSIIRQNALTNANATLNTYFEGTELYDGDIWLDPMGEGRRPTPEEFAELVIEIAYKYAQFSSGQREAKLVESMAKGE